MSARTRYIVVETLISVVINTALSICFVLLVFHGQSQIPASGRHGIVADMAPQTFMVVFMSCLVPAWVTRRRITSGVLAWRKAEGEWPLSRILLTAAILAFAGTCLVVVISWTALPRLFPMGVSFHLLLISKALFGMVLAAAVTPLILAGVLNRQRCSTI